MEAVVAQKLKHKKPISKTKLKKTIKNIVCRPDPVNWLLASKEEHLRLETTLKKYRVTLPEFKKPHWNDIKDLPKEKRPRPTPCKRVEGLIFGLSECQESLKNGLCSGKARRKEFSNPQSTKQRKLSLKSLPGKTLLGFQKIRKMIVNLI
ncbi:uncharacterized protein LOC125063662 isoform X2 [Pieris napi]|uniref:uncharacterized protein LOC125063662 isoform X2 n=1 Tax=Pieris napi TaxID=78633 RepID=UPI001FB97323|nr:uncharacterized protein LOC125063662 isoform X2 [Pieris napi]